MNNQDIIKEELSYEDELDGLMKIRKEKLEELQKEGKNPFDITKYDRTDYAKEIIENNESLKENIKNTKKELFKEFVLIFPEKNKFENTLYQEFYYQNLRQLSYELEKQNSILIVFGFSFADEHIAEIVKRACNNPTLNIYIFCYKKNTQEEILAKLNFEKFPNNIKAILPEDNGNIDFNVFLKKLFEVNLKIESDNNE